MGIKIDLFCSNVETVLSNVSKYYVIGTLAGLSKVLFGTGQAVVAATATVLFGTATLAGADTTHAKRSWNHVKHGFGNIAAGIGESIPVVQQLMHKARGKDFFTYDFTLKEPQLITHQERKWMPYNSIILNYSHIFRSNVVEAHDVEYRREIEHYTEFTLTQYRAHAIAQSVLSNK